MTKSDVTRGLIDFAVSQCLKNMKNDSRRSLRRLNDLGLQAAKGRFQSELFFLFQRMLNNDNSPYYEMLDEILFTTDTAFLKDFGINLGYNAWTLGAAQLRRSAENNRLPLSWLTELKPAASIDALSSQISRERENGRFAFLASLPEEGIGSGTGLFTLFRRFHDCDFLLNPRWTGCSLSSGQLEEAVRCTNLLFLLPFGSIECHRLAERLLAFKRTFIVTYTYEEKDFDELLSPEHIEELLSWGSPLLSFLPSPACSAQTRKAVDEAILDARMQQKFPALLIHWQEDIDRISNILSSPAQHTFADSLKTASVK